MGPEMAPAVSSSLILTDATYSPMPSRAERVDAASVDRTHLKSLPLRGFSPEAESKEPRLEEIRAAATLQDRMNAWRAIFRQHCPSPKR